MKAENVYRSGEEATTIRVRDLIGTKNLGQKSLSHTPPGPPGRKIARHILDPVTLGWGPLQATAAPRNDRNSQGMNQEAA